MKKIISIILALSVFGAAFTGCGPQQSGGSAEVTYTGITLSDDGILVGGQAASTDPTEAVYVSDDIIFYLEGQGADYGEGEADEGHSQQEADKHTVINITQPGNYTFAGSLSYGQIAVNLGKDAKKDPNAVVNIILNNADITSTVAPAIVCYKAYECGSDDVEKATKDVDISTAGFNITIADGSVNTVNGSHVAKIYKEGTTDKLHKYDAAIESMVSFNIYGNDGILNVNADNEGIETKMHLTIHGGEINIHSADDSLNAGEDGVSVITINDGKVLANANGGSEGDGIDSNGWLVINGGYVSAYGNENSMDSGVDSDNGIYINGGTVFATGNMYDEVKSDSQQTYAVFGFGTAVEKGNFVVFKSSQGTETMALESVASGTSWVYSSPMLAEDQYTAYKTDSVTGEGVNGVYANISATGAQTQLAHFGGGMMGGRPGMVGGMDFGNMPQGDMNFGNMPQNVDFSQMPQNDKGGRPSGGQRPNGQMPGGMGGMKPKEGFGGQMPEGFNGQMPENFNGKIPEGFDKDNMPEFNQGNMPEDFDFSQFGGVNQSTGTAQTIFQIVKGANMFSGITEYTAE